MQTLGELNSRFSGLFTKRDSEDDGESEEDDGGDSSGIGFNRWGWMITLDTLSGGDATKYPYYYELNVIEFLTVCSYYKSKREYEEQPC